MHLSLLDTYYKGTSERPKSLTPAFQPVLRMPCGNDLCGLAGGRLRESDGVSGRVRAGGDRVGRSWAGRWQGAADEGSPYELWAAWRAEHAAADHGLVGVQRPQPGKGPARAGTHGGPQED